MRFSPEFAEIRFGCGLSPVVPPVASVEAMLAGLSGADDMAARFGIEHYDAFRARQVMAKKIRRKRRDNRGTELGEKLRKELNLLKKAARQDMTQWFGASLLRRAYTQTGFRERLAFFWADHFTARGKAGVSKRATSPYIEEAIRPHLSGRFADLLIAAVSHPLMLHYLDQDVSMGPGSVRALKRGKSAGLNENLAREVLELHTLGVSSSYTQTDVRELAELFTGMSSQAEVGAKFRKDYAEPGAETVMGVTYGETGFGPVRAVLNDLAVHPDTAAHIARKLATHFVSDTPDPALVAHIAARFLATGGDLMASYAALLEHPAAWDRGVSNVKLPVDFVGSALRALAVPEARVMGLDEKAMRAVFITPMAQMGQNWQQPGGPDGWPEEDANWITPQGLSARVRWAMAAPQQVMPQLPDPREFVVTALGAEAPEVVRFAAAAAESKPEALGLVLASPAFQRR